MPVNKISNNNNGLFPLDLTAFPHCAFPPSQTTDQNHQMAIPSPFSVISLIIAWLGVDIRPRLGFVHFLRGPAHGVGERSINKKIYDVWIDGSDFMLNSSLRLFFFFFLLL